MTKPLAEVATAGANPTSSINGVARNSLCSAALIVASRHASAAPPAALSTHSTSLAAIHC
jgi:hypothetical protein